jgi:hypothetical protein
MHRPIKTKRFSHFVASVSNGIKNNLKYILLDKELSLGTNQHLIMGA